jgi:hypothetical protein
MIGSMLRQYLRWVHAVLVVALCACSSPGSSGGGDDDPDGPNDDEETPPCSAGECEIDGLDSAVGCAGVFNPDQLLDYRLRMSAGDWSALKADGTFSAYFPAQFQCGDDPALGFQVGVRRKRSGGTDKPGLKVDFNEYTAGASYFSLRKLSLENGVSSGSSTASPADAVAEYHAWRMMVLSGTISSRAAFARVFVNDELIGVYVNVEQVDKRFLRSRGKDDEGWLYKLSGGDDDGYQTNETTPNPHDARLCFFGKNPCPVPSAQELATYLPRHLDIDQMLRFGGINALVANSDGPLVKENNFYFYDDPAGAPRLYIPWDLDTTMKNTSLLFGATGSTLYTSVLFTHWEDDYDELFTKLLAGSLSAQTVLAELDRVQTVAGAALDADPAFIGEPIADEIARMKAWWSARHAQITAELAAHAP